MKLLENILFITSALVLVSARYLDHSILLAQRNLALEETSTIGVTAVQYTTKCDDTFAEDSSESTQREASWFTTPSSFTNYWSTVKPDTKAETKPNPDTLTSTFPLWHINLNRKRFQ